MSSNSSKQKHIELCKTTLVDFFDKITKEYELIGTTPELIEDHLSEIDGHLESFLDDLLKQVRNQRYILTAKLDILYEKYVMLMNRFREDVLIQKDLMPLIKLNEYLEKHVEKLEQQLSDNLAEIAKLNAEMNDVCKTLGTEAELLQTDPLPTRLDLDTFRQRIESLQSRKFVLIEELIQKKNLVLQLATDINYKPESETESSLIFGHDSSFILSIENFVSLDELINKLNERHRDRKSYLNTLRVQLDVLAKCLQKTLSEDELNTVGDYRLPRRQLIDVAEVDRVTEDFLLCEKINYFSLEIKKAEKIKQENQEKYLNELKKQITEMWQKCEYGEQQKNEFLPYFSSEVSGEQVNLCEQHLNQLTIYYETNKSIFETFGKWQFFWDEHMKIEESDSEKPANRYKNRGCTLLQEERRRNLVEKKLHFFESKLIEESHDYKCRNGKAFMVLDKDVIEFVKSKQSEFKTRRENRLREKKLMRSGTPSTLSAALSTMSLSQNVRSGQSTSAFRYLTPQPHKPNGRVLTPLALNQRSDAHQTPHNILGKVHQSRLRMQQLKTPKSLDSKLTKRKSPSSRLISANQNVPPPPPLRRKIPVQLSHVNSNSIVVKGKRLSSSFSSKKKQIRLSLNRKSLNYDDFIEQIPNFSSSKNEELES